jgi:membrane fusion protein, multidrug efflux system
MANPVEETPAEQDERRQALPSREPAAQVNGEPKKNGRLWLILGVVLVIAAAVGYFMWTNASARETTDDAEIDGHIAPISPRVGGAVVDIKVTDNQEVKAGDVLFQIDPADYKVAVDQAVAELTDAQATAQGAQANVPVTSIGTSSNISTAEAGVSEAAAGVSVAQKNVGATQAKVQSTQAKLQEAEANYTKANQDLERYRQLVEKEEISRQQFDAAVATAAAARATVESNRALVAEAQQDVAAAESQVQQARAQDARALAAVRAASSAPQQVAATRAQAASAQAKVQQKQAALDQAQLNLQYTTVKAPFTGVIGNKTVQLGQVVQAGQQTMALIRLDDVWVTANFKESQLKQIRSGQRVTFSVDAYGREYRGHIDTVAAATGARFSLLPPENATGNYVKVVQRLPVKVLLDEPNEGHLLRPGMSVGVKAWIK